MLRSYIYPDLCGSLVRQQIALPASKTGFIQMNLRNHPISGDIASFAWSIVMERDSLSGESRTLIRTGAFRSDTLVQGRPPDGRGFLNGFMLAEMVPRSKRLG